MYAITQQAKGGKDTMAMQYSYTGQVLVTAHGHQYGNGTGPSFREWYRNTYDAQTGQMTLSEHKVNNIAWQIMSSNTYDDMGRVSSTTYGANAETQNFTYNIRGELQGINENYVLTGNNGGQSITFGEVLRYDYGYDSLRYDGMAAGMIWRASGAGNARAHSYGYIYDVAGRMLKGAYMRSNTTPSYTLATGWSNSTNDYSETVTYDQGGNILTLQRRAVVAANQMVFPTNVDNLTYTYTANSNKLQKVVDATTTNYGRGDYLYTATQGYSYDYAGNLTADVSKNISNIAYTWFDKPATIAYGGTNKIGYIYDAAGNKIQEYVINPSPATATVTSYIGTAIYKNDTLQSISTPVGRTDLSKGGTQEQYFVKDHLGNIRSVVVDAAGNGGIGGFVAQSQTYNATYETNNIAQEELSFDNVGSVSEDKPESTSATDAKAAQIQADNTATVGTTLMLKVMSGDKLSLNADNYYESGTAPSSSSVSASTFEQVVNSLAQAAGQLSGTEGSLANDWAAQMLNSSSLQQAYDALQSSYTDPSKPKAYLNFLFFDEQMQLVPEFCRIWQADGSDTWSRIGTDGSEVIAVPQNGYVATYISTQSTEPTYFDNLTVTLEPGVLLEEKHYYPYGLPIVGMGSTASGMLPNKSRYQSNEYREDLGLNWMDFHNRQYDPQLGRFLSLDPLADASGQQSLSPYHAMACNPSTMVDPLGLAAQYSAALSNPNINMAPAGLAFVEGQSIMLGASLLEGGVSDMMRNLSQTMDETHHDQQVMTLYYQLVAAEGNANAQDIAASLSNLGGNSNLKTETSKITEVMNDAVASNGPGPVTALKRTNLIGWALEAIEELFVTTSTAITPMTRLAVQVDVKTIAEAKEFAKSEQVKKRNGQVGSYTIYFSNGMKYHGKGPLTRMVTSATSRMTDVPADEMMMQQMLLHKVGVTTLDWTPATSDREAFKQEYYRMQTDRTRQYQEGYMNPINYNKVQSPGKKYVEQDGI